MEFITKLHLMLRIVGFLLMISFIFYHHTFAQSQRNTIKESSSSEFVQNNHTVKFGIASYYANKFNGRPTANGEIYSSEKFTAACNQLPFNTWIKVTCLKNSRSVIVKINDRLNPHNRRLVDLSEFAAKKLGILGRGIAKVKVEVLNNYPENK